MRHRIENVETGTWNRVIEDLKASGFEEVYRYGGMDAGIDYNRCELVSRADGELVVFEWDNWSEGEIRAELPRLEALREKYRLSEPSEVDGP
ncbi:MAG TPA: hypothetical protein VD968_14505 [Pyrinomonadaceae bacterium]|nr:hypothetical protein [Pyrinomonadaceae bacterium]